MADEADVIDAPPGGADTVQGGQDTVQGAADTVQGGQDTVAGGEDTIAAVQPDWAADWRDKLAAGDDKFAAKLKRFQSPVDVAKSYRALEKELTDIKASRPPVLPEKPTDADIAEYRKALAIPEKAEGYLSDLPNGLVIGEEDKPLAGSFAEAMHALHAPPAIVKAGLDWYYKNKEDTAAEMSKADAEYRQKSVDALRAEWGGEYRANFNAAMAFLDSAPSEGDTPLKDLLLGARLSDGTLAGDNPMVLKWLVQMANDANPAGFVSPGAGTSQIESVRDEIATIEKTMRENRAAYDKDEKMQKRLVQLYEAEEKLSKAA